MKNPFDIFDKIICICGKHEEDRWEKVQTQFDSVGILNRIERFDEVIDWERAVVVCFCMYHFTAHRMVPHL